MPHPTHLALQIFAVIKPVVSDFMVFGRTNHIRDLDGSALHTNTNTKMQTEGIKTKYECVL